MTLQLLRVEDAGELDRERVVFRAAGETEIGRYAVFRCRASENGAPRSGPVPNAYWFPNKIVESNDLVVLYTKAGVISEKKGEAIASSYFYYWRVEEPIWVRGYVPVLVETPTWCRGEPLK
jgi:hypothetical protein